MSAAKYIRANVAAMEGYVPGEQPRDSAVVKLNTNENPYPPSPRVAEALRSVAVDGLRRYPDPMATALRDAISGLHGCRRGQVFAGNGSDEVLALCLRAFVENDGSVGYFDPSYSLYPVLADIQGIEKRPVALTEDFGWNMPADYRAALFFLTNPNAPTSMLFKRETVAEFCRTFDGVVVIDEAYVDFAERDCMDLALASDNVLVARTLSKAYSLAGIRLGYLVGDESLIAALYKIKDSYNINSLSQALARAAIEDQAHMRANRDRVVATRERTARQLEQLGFRVCPSQSNFLWVRPPDMSAAELFAELKRRSIYIRHFQQDSICDWLRISIGTDAEMECLISELIDCAKGASL